MNNEYKRVLYIDLSEESSEFKIHEDLFPYIGGIGISTRIMLDNLEDSPVILTAGPLCGYFPYVSKSNLIYINSNTLVERYGGRDISRMLTMADIDAFVFKGQTEKYLGISIFEADVSIDSLDADSFQNSPASFSISDNGAFSLGYFSFGDIRGKNPFPKGGVSVTIESTDSLELKNYYDYERLYSKILDDYKMLTVEPRNNPSCFGCPIGCDKSKIGEEDLNVAILPRCLISCAYAESIYKDIPNVYACLNSVGYNYHHNELEALPSLVGDTRIKIDDILENRT